MTREGFVPAGGSADRPLRMSVEQARRRADRRRGAYTHIPVFGLGNTANFVVNWVTLGDGGHRWWFQWALIAWSAALGVQAINVVGREAWFAAAEEDSTVRSKTTRPPGEPESGRPFRSVDVVQVVCDCLTEPAR